MNEALLYDNVVDLSEYRIAYMLRKEYFCSIDTLSLTSKLSSSKIINELQSAITMCENALDVLEA